MGALHDCGYQILRNGAAIEIYRNLTMVLSANKVIEEQAAPKEDGIIQMDLFTDYEALEKQKAIDEAALEREKKMQQASALSGW